MRKLLLLLTILAIGIGVEANNQSVNNRKNIVNDKRMLTSNAPENISIITEQPEGEIVTYIRGGDYLVVSLYGYETNPQAGQVKVTFAPDGKTVYIQDPLAYGEGTGVWVKGELSDDGSQISVPLGQYVSYNEEFGYGLVLDWGSTELVDLGEGDYWLMFQSDEQATAVIYKVDPTEGTLTLQGGIGDANADFPDNLIGTGLAGVWSDDVSIATMEWNTTWKPLTEVAPAVPKNPEALEFFDCGTEEGYTRFDFNIILEDVDGNPLNSDYVTYSIFTDDDQLFVFDYPTYGLNNNFDTDMTEIPYGYSGEDFYLRRVYFYRTNKGDNPLLTDRIGIQVYYTVEGEKNASDIVYIDVAPAVIDAAQTGKTIKNERYYNLSGQELKMPNGVVVKVTTYDDGTVSTRKVVE